MTHSPTSPAVFAWVVFLGLCASVYAKADSLIFDLGPTNSTTVRGSDDGPGQGVIASSTTTIDAMSFFLNLPSGGDVDYMIWNGSNTTLLYSQVFSVGASSTAAWVKSAPFSFTLDAGSEYYFGVIADNDMDVGYIYPTISYATGLIADESGNSDYSNFDSPSFRGLGLAEIGLQLYGGESTVPEPSSFVLFGTGAIAAAGAVRRRFTH